MAIVITDISQSTAGRAVDAVVRARPDLEFVGFAHRDRVAIHGNHPNLTVSYRPNDEIVERVDLGESDVLVDVDDLDPQWYSSGTALAAYLDSLLAE